MICQDKNKYDCPKYRLIVRFTNKYVICQIAYSTLEGDKIICQAHSSELVRYGYKAGLKNYAAAYCTGLLIARRLLKMMKLDEAYSGQEEVTGAVVKTDVGKQTYYVSELQEKRRPFHCILDVGIVSTSTGARVFGCMKGATDGGLDIPHNEKRFPGYDRDTKEFDAEVHREHIFGGHIAGYMEYLMEEDEALYKEHFATYIEAGLTNENLEEMIEEVHQAIREDPSPSPKSSYIPTVEDKKIQKRHETHI
jgi:large subunit ribosomal protein L5e